MSKQSLHPMLIVEDGSSHLWRIWPSGRAQYVEDVEYSKVVALEPSETLRLEHLQNREPFELMRYELCEACRGAEEVDAIGIFEWVQDRKDEPPYESFVRWVDGALSVDDVCGLRKGQFARAGRRDCTNEECHEGLVLQRTAVYVERHELLGRVAA